jgi:hypothetical protein
MIDSNIPYTKIEIITSHVSTIIKMLRFVITVLLIMVSVSQVIGIDFGTEFWKSAIISPGKGFVVVENSKSERKTSNVVIVE